MDREQPIHVGGLIVKVPPSISPSSLRCARQCRLRALLETGGTRQALPSHPSSYAGTIAHRVLEAAQRGKAGRPPEVGRLARSWRLELDRIQDRIAADPRREIDRSLVPLTRTCVGLERCRLKVIQLALSVEVVTGATGSGSNVERHLKSQDGKIFGKADRVIFSSGGVTLRDYKTGRVTTDAGDIKESYVDQLHLYGALLIEKEPSLRGRLRLELVDGDGLKHLVKYQEKYADEVGKIARLELMALGRSVEDLRAGRLTLRDLANVSVAHCGYCQFRPNCPGWLPELDAQGMVALGSVVDLSRRYLERHELSSKLTAIRLAGGELVTGLGTPEVDLRSSVLSATRPGDLVRFFNLRPPRRLLAPYVAQSTSLCTLATTPV